MKNLLNIVFMSIILLIATAANTGGAFSLCKSKSSAARREEAKIESTKRQLIQEGKRQARLATEQAVMARRLADVASRVATATIIAEQQIELLERERQIDRARRTGSSGETPD